LADLAGGTLLDTLTLLLHFTQYMIGGLIVVSLGTILVNIPPDWKKILSAALFYAVSSLYLDSLPLVFGLGTLITVLLVSCVAMVIWFLPFFQAVISVLVGVTVHYLLDGAVVPIVIDVFHINAALPTPEQFVWLFIPQFLIAVLIVYLCHHFDIYMMDFEKPDTLADHPMSGLRDKLVFALYAFILILIIFEMIYNLSDFGYSFEDSIQAVNIRVLDWISNILVISALIIVSILLKHLLLLSEKESEYLVQKSYAETLEELYTAVRAQQHDLINHFQTLYGFLQLHYTEEALHYLESLMGSTPVLKRIADSGSIPLSSLFYIKSGLAMEANICFDLDIRATVENINIPSYELNRVIGNLINNAFEAVADQIVDNRWVTVKIEQDDLGYIFEVSNYGSLSEEMREMVLEKGFSTKNQNGLGLFIVKGLMQKYQGQLDIYSKDNQITITLRLPKQSRG
jgi:two-component system, LytTR family, sensor histidine kinase AgrC